MQRDGKNCCTIYINRLSSESSWLEDSSLRNEPRFQEIDDKWLGLDVGLIRSMRMVVCSFFFFVSGRASGIVNEDLLTEPVLERFALEGREIS